MSRPARPVAERYWPKVCKDGPVVRPELGPCWTWSAAVTEHGYGVMGRGPRGTGVVRASHVSWEIHNGPVPEGAFVLHKCDNPPCTNPAHLFLGDAAANMADAVAKRRHAHGETSYAKLREADVIEIKRTAVPQAALAACFGVSRALIGMIRQGKRWGHVA